MLCIVVDDTANCRHRCQHSLFTCALPQSQKEKKNPKGKFENYQKVLAGPRPLEAKSCRKARPLTELSSLTG